MAQKHTLAKMETEKDYPYSAQFDDIYFSKENGVAETTHVFINGNNLPARFSRLRPREIFTIAETGFGTGLNALIAAQEFLKHAPAETHLYFYSIEKFPLSRDAIEMHLQQWRNQFPEIFDRYLGQYPLRVGGWHTMHIHDRITFVVAFDDVARAIHHIPTQIDAWFLDGFAPAKNPDMWSQNLFDGMARLSHHGSTLASFTAAGHVRRGLEQAGFHIEKTKGYGHKRDMITGQFHAPDAAPLSPRLISSPQKIAVIGAGISGAQMAHHLKRDHHDVTIFEMNDVASGASGNPIGLYNPRLSAERTEISDFYSSAFAAARRVFQNFHDVEFYPSGALHLITDETKEKRFHSCITSWDWHDDHAKIVTPEMASDIAGISINKNALYLKDSGYISPYKISQFLLKDARVIKEKVTHIQRGANGWNVNGHEFDHVVITSGASSIIVDDIPPLTLQSVRGQIAIVKSKSNISAAICFGGYLSPGLSHDHHTHILGSSFQPWLEDSEIRDEDNFDMVQKLYEAVPALTDSITVTGARVGFRAAAPDRTPMIGRYPHADGVWISGAHGSHGLLSSLMGGKIISAEISGRPPEMGAHILHILDPIRFEKRLKNDTTKP